MDNPASGGDIPRSLSLQISRMAVSHSFRSYASAMCSRVVGLIMLAAAIITTSVGAAIASGVGVEESFQSHLEALAATLPQQAQQALERIESPDRALLAARSYARAGAELATRWSWTAQQIRQFESSAEYGHLMEHVRRVTRHFEAQNPGYSLYANMEVRTLEVQLARWNGNPRVGATAEELSRAVKRELAHGYPSRATPDSVDRFRDFLVRWYPSTPAPLAAPGLSAHGQLRAVDFQITKDAKVIAGPSIGSVRSAWERSGWRDKLLQAVRSSNAAFVGPLLAPNEPWHYIYEALH